MFAMEQCVRLGPNGLLETEAYKSISWVGKARLNECYAFGCTRGKPSLQPKGAVFGFIGNMALAMDNINVAASMGDSKAKETLKRKGVAIHLQVT